MRRSASILLIVVIGLVGHLLAQGQRLPNTANSVKFAVIGDNGTGDQPQYEVGAQMARARASFAFDSVIMLGDNMYGSQQPADFIKKFEQPYKALLDAGVQFFATLGNHDNQLNRYYKPYNMGGERYYSFVKKNVRFFVLDTDSLDPKQMAWLEDALRRSTDEWKICYFHHPLYSDGGTHGSAVELRVVLEPIFLKYGVNVVFSGHEHFYERLTPQKGIYYFISGGAAKLRDGDVKASTLTAKSFDSGYHFMLIELGKDSLNFQAISDQGKTVDSGALPRFSAADKKKLSILTSQ